jgi:hypothetical protein
MFYVRISLCGKTSGVKAVNEDRNLLQTSWRLSQEAWRKAATFVTLVRIQQSSLYFVARRLIGKRSFPFQGNVARLGFESPAQLISVVPIGEVTIVIGGSNPLTADKITAGVTACRCGWICQWILDRPHSSVGILALVATCTIRAL